MITPQTKKIKKGRFNGMSHHFSIIFQGHVGLKARYFSSRRVVFDGIPPETNEFSFEN